MRGHAAKAAVWLLPLFASLGLTLVIPDDIVAPGYASSTRFDLAGVVTGAVIDHQPLDGLVNFTIPCPTCSTTERRTVEEAVFALRVLPSENACLNFYETGVSLNGRDLPTKHGESTFEIGNSSVAALQDAGASWQINCVCLRPNRLGLCENEDIATVLVFTFITFGGRTHPGFTVTYKQIKANILKLSFFPDTQALDVINSIRSRHWQSPFLSSSEYNPPSDIKLYHSTVLDRILSLPTASGTNIPVLTGTSTAAYVQVTPFQEESDNVTPPELHLDDFSTRTPPAAQPNQQILTGSVTHHVIRHTLESLYDKARFLAQTVTATAGRLTAYNELLSAGKTQEPGQIEFRPLKQADSPVAYDTSQSATPTILPVEELSASPSPTPSPTFKNTFVSDSPSPTSASPSQASASSSPPSTSPYPSNRSSVHHAQTLRALKYTSLIALIVSIIGCCFVLVTCACRDPRMRADCAARREERRNRRLYKTAAQKQRFKNWMESLKRTRFHLPFITRDKDWAEKRLPPTNCDWDESSKEDITDELYALRNAHQVVDGILKAEEGRQSSRARRSRRQCTPSLFGPPSDDTEPPRYDDIDVVFDGFRYVRPRDDYSPDSSVIDTSPRTSIYLSHSDCEKSDSEKE